MVNKGVEMNQDTIEFINEYYKEDFDLFLQKEFYTKEELNHWAAPWVPPPNDDPAPAVARVATGRPARQI